ncbi:hypothetical protein DFJ58DRAFT_832864 [Suillus subalutaceus]|uniref:uncharacterized protein n=1 Tax=Suillus subalutaceus TaxID=48586 RepID=UPI001B86B01D|nr:uncharacterized protein DFJ58DRAFT_832864 [Suillus subalutaceus]KAG1819399.1 hypothetical protein DFJ58DRAFT_832864 [Suillus subalutaceus]
MISLRPVVFSILLTSLTLVLCLFCCWTLSHHVILPLLAFCMLLAVVLVLSLSSCIVFAGRRSKRLYQ